MTLAGYSRVLPTVWCCAAFPGLDARVAVGPSHSVRDAIPDGFRQDVADSEVLQQNIFLRLCQNNITWTDEPGNVSPLVFHLARAEAFMVL